MHCIYVGELLYYVLVRKRQQTGYSSSFTIRDNYSQDFFISHTDRLQTIELTDQPEGRVLGKKHTNTNAPKRTTQACMRMHSHNHNYIHVHVHVTVCLVIVQLCYMYKSSTKSPKKKRLTQLWLMAK